MNTSEETQSDPSGPPPPPPHAGPPSPVKVGDVVDQRYAIQEMIGAGGMGLVYRATEDEIERDVALKFILVDDSLPKAEQDEYYERFRNEAQALGSLPPHANRVVLYQYGQHADAAYMAMEFVRGKSLADVMDDGLTVDRIVTYARQMAMALVDVHASGIVHRDIKPENLIVTRSLLGDELLKLIDFGIARAPFKVVGQEAQEEDDDREILGTVLYMAPELILDGIETPQTDIYAMGVILYELLTGDSPFAHAMQSAGEGTSAYGHDAMELVRHHVETDPGPIKPRPGLGDLPEGLKRVVTRCLAKDADKRFVDARALLKALDAFRRRSRHSTQLRPMSRDEAATLPRESGETLADVRMVPSTNLGAEVVSTAVDGATSLVAAADISGDVRVWNYETGHQVYTIQAPGGSGVTATRRTRLAFAPGGKLLAIGDRLGRLWIVDVALRSVEKMPLRRGAPIALAFDAAASLMVVATTAGILELWDLPNRKQLARFTFDPSGDSREKVADAVQDNAGGIRSLDLSPGRHFLAAGTEDGVIHVWNFKERERSSRLQAPPPVPGQHPDRDPNAPAVYMSFDPEEALLAVVRESGWLEVWDPATGLLQYRTVLPEEGPPRRICYSPEGDQAIVMWDTGSIVLLDPRDGSVIDQIRIPRGRAVNLTHTDDGVPVASLGRGSTVQVWDLLALGRIATLGPYPTHLLDVTVSRFNTALTLSSGGFVDRWDLCTGRHLGRQDLGAPSLRELHKAPHIGGVLTCGPRDGLIAFEGFDRNGAPLQRDVLPVPPPAGNEHLATYSTSPDGKLLALGYENGDVRLYAYGERSQAPRFLPSSAHPISTVCFSPDGNTLAVADAMGHLRLLSVETGDLVWEESSGHLPIRMVAFTPSGRLLSIPRGNKIEVWNLEMKRRVARLSGHDAPIRTLVHGLEGRLLLSASEDGTARLWDMAQQRALRVLDDHPGPVTAATLDPDLRLLLTTSGPYLSIWRVSDAELLGRFCYCGPRDQVDTYQHWVAFSSTGHYIASDVDPPHIEFYRPGSSTRLSTEAREALLDPLAVARTLLADS